jgi:hypothetical protein
VSTTALRQVTLTKAWEPGVEGAAGERIEFAAVLDANNMPDAEAWLADPAPWPPCGTGPAARRCAATSRMTRMAGSFASSPARRTTLTRRRTGSAISAAGCGPARC